MEQSQQGQPGQALWGPVQVTSAGQAAVVGLVPLLGEEELRLHVLQPLDVLVRHDEDEVGMRPEPLHLTTTTSMLSRVSCCTCASGSARAALPLRPCCHQLLGLPAVLSAAGPALSWVHFSPRACLQLGLAQYGMAVHLLWWACGRGLHWDCEIVQVRCVATELLCTLGSHVEGTPVEAEVLPRVLHMASDDAYLVRKVARMTPLHCSSCLAPLLLHWDAHACAAVAHLFAAAVVRSLLP